MQHSHGLMEIINENKETDEKSSDRIIFNLSDDIYLYMIGLQALNQLKDFHITNK